MALAYQVRRLVAPASSTTETITHSLGVVPDLVLVFANGNTTLNTFTGGAELMIGAYDGTTQAAIGVTSRDGMASTDADRRAQSKILTRKTPFWGYVDDVTASSLDASGVDLAWTRADSHQFYYLIVFLAGLQNAEVITGSVAGGSSSTSTAFQADGGIHFTAGLTFPGDSYGMGGTSFATFDSTRLNTSQHIYQQSGAADGEPQAGFFSGESSLATWFTGINRSYYITSIGATAINWASSIGSAALGFGMAIAQMPTGKGIYSSYATTPTSTGTASLTGAGFKPGLAILVGGLRDTLNTQKDHLDSDDKAGGLFVTVADGTNTYCMALHMEDDATTTNEGSIMTTDAIYVPHDDGTGARVKGDALTFTANGIDIDFDTTVDATYGFHYWYMLFEEEGSTGYALTAPDLTNGTPTLDAPVLGEIHALTGVDLTNGVPVLDAPVLAEIHALTALDLTNGTPTLDAPVLGQVYALTAPDLVNGTPSLDVPVLGEIHALTGVDLTNGVPVLDAPILAEIHALTAPDLTNGTPVLDAPVLGRIYVLVANDLVNGVPVLDAPVLGEIHALTVVDLTNGVPVLDAPVLAEIHALTGTDLVNGVPVLDTPALDSASIALTALDLTNGVPVLDAPALGRVYNLVAPDLVNGVPVLDAPVLGEIHALTGVGLANGVPVLDVPVLAEIHALAVIDLVNGVPVLDVPALTQTHILTAPALTNGVPTLDAPILAEIHALAVIDLVNGVPVLDAPILGEIHALTGVDLTNGVPALDTPILSIAGAIPLDAPGLTNGVPTLDAPALVIVFIAISVHKAQARPATHQVQARPTVILSKKRDYTVAPFATYGVATVESQKRT